MQNRAIALYYPCQHLEAVVTLNLQTVASVALEGGADLWVVQLAPDQYHLGLGAGLARLALDPAAAEQTPVVVGHQLQLTKLVVQVEPLEEVFTTVVENKTEIAFENFSSSAKLFFFYRLLSKSTPC